MTSLVIPSVMPYYVNVKAETPRFNVVCCGVFFNIHIKKKNQQQTNKTLDLGLAADKNRCGS